MGALFWVGVSFLLVVPAFIEDELEIPTFLTAFFSVFFVLGVALLSRKYIDSAETMKTVVGVSMIGIHVFNLSLCFIIKRVLKGRHTQIYEKAVNEKEDKIKKCFFRFEENGSTYCCKKDTTIKINRGNCERCVEEI